MDIGNIAAWFALALGIWNAFKAHSSTKTSKRVDAIEALIFKLKKIELDAKRYWLTPPQESSSIAAEIKTDLRDFSFHARRASVVLWPNVEADLKSLRQVVTGDDFEVSTRAVTPSSSMKVIKMESVVADFMRKLHDRIGEINPL